jgi:hypothetical protein
VVSLLPRKMALYRAWQMAFPLRLSPGVGLRRLTSCWTILFACSVSLRSYMLSRIWVSKENGIFDAIEKQYLRSFIFAIYLVRIAKTLRSYESPTQTSQGPRRSEQVGRIYRAFSFRAYAHETRQYYRGVHLQL